MRGSAKGGEPDDLCAWKKVQRAHSIEPEYRNLPRPERQVMVNALFAEQTGQCVYCGRRIALARQRYYHIEHFRPRSKYPKLDLEHTNLFLSCGPDSRSGVRQSCGNHKEDWFEEDCHIPPAPESCAERFRFHSSGEIAGDDSPEAETMIKVLNLNHPELVAERQVMIEDLEHELNEGAPPDDLRQGYLDTDGNGARPGFANVAIQYLTAQSRFMEPAIADGG